MTRLVFSRATGRIHRLPDAEAAAAVAQGEGVPMQAVRFTAPNVGPYTIGEIATFPDAQAARLISLGYAEPVPLDVAPAPAAEVKGLEGPPADRMVHRGPVTKGVEL